MSFSSVMIYVGGAGLCGSCHPLTGGLAMYNKIGGVGHGKQSSEWHFSVGFVSMNIE